jgi:phenylalanine-4-hydroxylase
MMMMISAAPTTRSIVIGPEAARRLLTSTRASTTPHTRTAAAAATRTAAAAAVPSMTMNTSIPKQQPSRPLWFSSKAKSRLVDIENDFNVINNLHGGSIPTILNNEYNDDDDKNNNKTTKATTTTSSGSSNSKNTFGLYNGELPRTSLLMELTDRVGILHEILRYFWKHNVNICRIESRPANNNNNNNNNNTKDRTFDFFVDLEGDPQTDDNVAKLLRDLHPLVTKLLILDEKKVHWFPRHVSELDLIAGRTLSAGVDLMADDHPGFNDPVYRQRRAALTISAQNHSWQADIPRIDYTSDELHVWTTVWDKMQDLWRRYACREFLHSLELLQTPAVGYRRDNIPQLQDISTFLQQRTQFRLRPVAGLLSSRDFLNGLAFRTFFCTQYIRHASRPLYTPEPDICHELLGHVPMFCNYDFADFSQEIGLASLGASDDDVDKLAKCYWHSVEFGLCREDDHDGLGPKNKAYGAGLLSSFGELEYACSSEHPGADHGPPKIKPWDPDVACRQEFPITSYQPVYFLADSLQDAKQRMRQFCKDLPRPFFAQHNAQTDTVHIDRPVVRTKGIPPPPPATPGVP